MKTCAVCQTQCEPGQDTCHACGEASWHPGSASDVPAPEASSDPSALASLPAIALGPGDAVPAAEVVIVADEPDGAPEVTETIDLADAATPVAEAPASEGQPQ